ncbi:Ankyrin repeat domain-containing protein [Plasmodiophora brassicae]|uniref:Uncharacterized protein n=1 Tax=Plasmodiophora brassicae TaxID=37360 RepID=A0A0G4IV97_PLABS|nr:hypothetical protein PBRA_001154 [Plasmodiophora brassicae]SPQ97258.1 unnamed protein product [Plasmodiophora brassicae]
MTFIALPLCAMLAASMSTCSAGLFDSSVDVCLRKSYADNNGRRFAQVVEGATYTSRGWACRMFHDAVRRNRVDLVRSILTWGQRLNDMENCEARDDNDRVLHQSALSLAIDNNNLDMVKVLFQSQNGPRLPKGRSSVPYASAKKGTAGIVAFLLDNDAHLKDDDCYWANAMIAAIGTAGDVAIVQVLLDKISPWTKATRSYLHEAVQHNNVPVARVLLERNVVQVDERGDCNNTALHVAVAKPGQIEMVALLLEKGADPRLLNIYCKSVYDVCHQDYHSNLAFAKKTIASREAKKAAEAQERHRQARLREEEQRRLALEQAERDAEIKHKVKLQRLLDQTKNATSEAIDAFRRSILKRQSVDEPGRDAPVSQPTSSGRIIAKRALQASAALVLGATGLVLASERSVEESHHDRPSGKLSDLVNVRGAIAPTAAITLAVGAKILRSRKRSPGRKSTSSSPSTSSIPAFIALSVAALFCV